MVPKRPKKVDHGEFRTNRGPGDSRERSEAIPDASYRLWEEIQSLKIVDHFSVNSEVGFLIFHDKFVFGEVN